MSLVLLCASQAFALDDGLARTPPMGWNSWNRFQLNINEGLIRFTADTMVTNGMAAAGYHYLEPVPQDEEACRYWRPAGLGHEEVGTFF